MPPSSAPPSAADAGVAVGAVPAGVYSATIDHRSAGCCSQSCGARSTVASLDLEIHADGRLDARWARTGCNVTLSGNGPLMMPNDPGPPEALCGARPASSQRREVIDLTGAGALSGSWTREGRDLRVVLSLANVKAPWSLRCANSERDGGAARRLTCTTADGAWSESLDFTSGGALHLDDVPGLKVSERVPGFGASRRTELSR